MRNIFKYACGFAVGIVTTLTVLSIIKGCLNYEINIIEALMLVITTILTVAVVYLGNSLNKKGTACDIISKDLIELCDVYCSNILILERLNKGTISIEDAMTDIRMTFHRGDVIADMITTEIRASFPKFLKDENEIQNLTTSYWKWLTDGEMQEANFKVSPNFLKAHETKVRNTIANIKLLMHRLIKYA